MDEFLSNKSIKRVNRVLSNLRYKARTIREELGFNALYMAFGMLKWREGISGEFSKAPLILVPVDINREKLGARLKIEVLEEEIVVNPTLQTKLTNDFSVDLNDLAEELTTEEIQKYWQYVEELVQNFGGWQVQPTVALGIFNFQTLMIIKDLERNAEHYCKHPLIRVLSGHPENLLDIPSDVPEAHELDEEVSPMEVYQILDADSSQQEAIEAAKRGVSFVLQGPPGTGKSQTIANIIAESLAAGKKVLFVSQKSVALDVVYRRLSEHGLGEFCLEIHSYKKNKRDVIQDLGKSLTNYQEEIVRDTTQEKRELQQARSELNRYVKELHKPRLGMQWSLFKVRGELSKVYESPNLKFSLDEVEKIDTQQYQKHLFIIRELVSYKTLITNYKSHPWKGFSRQVSTITGREEIAEKFEQAAETLQSLATEIQGIARRLNLSTPETIEQCFQLLNILTTYKPLIFSEENAELVSRLLTKYNSITRFVTLQYWQDRRRISKLQWEDKRLPLGRATPILRMQRQLRESAISEGLSPKGELNISAGDIHGWLDQRRTITDLYNYASGLFNDDELPAVLRSRFETPLAQAVEWFQSHACQTDKIVDWVNFSNVVRRAREEGIGDFVEKALEQNIPPRQWEDTYKRRFFVLLSDAMTQSSDVLTKFRSSSYETLVNRFRQLDTELIRISSAEIRARLFGNRPDTTWVQADSAETIILRKELHKKRRIKPLRRLFAEIPNLILTLKPCLMMSPLTVSQLLDPAIYQFDIAIFDEASQIPPEYAVGTIMRARQVVIAGDRHQLPPTRFFQVIDSDESDEENYEIEEYESILDACDTIMPSKMLLWHYRSQDESLIAFSNYHFYDNKLLTFPSANSKGETTGLEFVYVPEGKYRRGEGARNNPIEARRVAELVLEHLRNSPELSLGIVAFSQSQRHAIEAEIERIKQENPHLYPLFDYAREEQIFVKNLETVQGDERDVIIFSIGYGKDELGRMTMNFGPLNRQGGERRLNVAVTRARRAVKLVASIEPEDIDLTRAKSRGARLLRNYMKTARDGASAIYEDERFSPNAEFDSPFEEAVYNALSKRGVRLHKQVGVSKYRIDFGVVDPEQPGRYLLGIECDGATYHSAPTARDRDRLRQQLLEDKFGWRIHRIWSRDWIENPDREIEKVLAAIEQSKRLGPRKPVKKKLTTSLNGSRDQSGAIDNTQPFPKNAQTYQEVIFEKSHSHRGADDFHSIPTYKFSEAIKRLVEAAGPIHREVVKRQIARSLQVKMGSRVRLVLDRAITDARMKGYVRIDGDFLWPPSMKRATLRIHNGARKRQIWEVPPQEIELAIIECVQNSISISEDDLVKETARLFRWRVTAKISTQLHQMIDDMITEGRLQRRFGKIMLEE